MSSPAMRALGVGAVVVAVVTGLALRGASQDKSAEVIEGPQDWVPLTYEVRVSSEGFPDAIYITYRSATGSTRKEVPYDDSIELMDMAERQFFRYHQGTWYQHPMRPQKRDGRPFLKLLRSRVTQVEPTDQRVQAAASAYPSCTFWETTARTNIYCPELNQLPVWTLLKDSAGATELTVSNIILGEPPVAFRPPAGVQVVERTEPDGPGIVTRTPSGLNLQGGSLHRDTGGR